jgi:hypothetical protein
MIYSECCPFLEWACQYPLMWQRVDMAIQRIVALTGVSGSTVCMEMRDCFHLLAMYADEGGFASVASFFYENYVQYCRLLLAYAS